MCSLYSAYSLLLFIDFFYILYCDLMCSTVFNNFLISFVLFLLSIVWLLHFFYVFNCIYWFFNLLYCDLLWLWLIIFLFLLSLFFCLLCGYWFSLVSLIVFIDFFIFPIVTYCVLLWFIIFFFLFSFFYCVVAAFLLYPSMCILIF